MMTSYMQISLFLVLKETTGPTEQFISSHQVSISDQFHIGAS